jgi:hypothetical protein
LDDEVSGSVADKLSSRSHGIRVGINQRPSTWLAFGVEAIPVDFQTLIEEEKNAFGFELERSWDSVEYPLNEYVI